MSNISFEEYLEQNGQLTYTIRGTSMQPMLKQGRDLFTVEKHIQGQSLHKGDVVLFRHRGNLVLHRIKHVYADGYDMLGDNCITMEKGVLDKDILGTLTEFVHKGKNIRVTNLFYRLYVKIWQITTPIRIAGKKLRLSVGSFLKKYRKNEE